MGLMEQLDQWAGGADEHTRARAIAAFGLLELADETDLAAAAGSPEALARLCSGTAIIQHPQAGWIIWRSVLADRRESILRLVSPQVAAACWDDFLPLWDQFRTPGRVWNRRVEVFSWGMDSVQAAGTYLRLNAVLVHPATGITSLYFQWWSAARAARKTRQSWHWPLRVGFLPDPRSRALHDTVRTEARSWYGDLLDAYVLAGGIDTCDLLVSPLRVEDTSRELAHARARCSALLVLGDPPEATAQAFREVAAIRARSGASAIAFAVPGGAEHSVVEGLLEQLSHDQYWDTAVGLASGSPSDRPPLVIADSEFVLRTRMSHVMSRAAGQVGRRGLAPEAQQLIESLPHRAYVSERGDASDLVRSMARLDARAEAPRPRYLQGKTWHLPSPLDVSRVLRPARSFRRRAWHIVEVHIGPPRTGERPTLDAFPEHLIEYEHGEAELVVALAAPGCQVAAMKTAHREQLDPSEPSPAQVKQLEEWCASLKTGEPAATSVLWIGPAGPSSRVRFALRPLETDHVHARILVTHGNRILQTALLSAEVREIDTPFAEVDSTSEFVPLTPECLTRVSLDELDDRRDFDAALLLNRGGDGKSRVTAMADGEVHLREFGDTKTASNVLRGILEEMVAAPESFTTPDSESLRKTLIRLALDGVLLYRTLVIDNGLENKLGAPGSRVQLVMAHPEAWVPLEFVYDGKAPDRDAQLCPNWQQALGEGDCLSCPNRDSRAFVCPVRFWGLNRVIERHIYDGNSAPEKHTATVDRSIAGRPRIGRPEAAMFARHTKAQDFDDGPAAVKAARESVVRAAGVVEDAESWKEWADRVASRHPTLFVVLPHTYAGDEGDCMEINDGSVDEHRLVCARVDDAIVGAAGAPPKVVILLGCDTADPNSPYAKFPAAFRLAGAHVVLGTLTSVLGRHAAPVVRELAQELDTYWSGRADPATMGDAIAQVRRRFFERGLPIGMVLVAYGDADWVLG